MSQEIVNPTRACRVDDLTVKPSANPTNGEPVALDWNAELVEQLHLHWTTQLRPRLDGLTDDEYFWEPVDGCWTVRRGDDGSYRPDWRFPREVIHHGAEVALLRDLYRARV
jgi:hypothetical protein